MSTPDSTFDNSRFLPHPLGASSITSLSFGYYFKNLILHLFPFLIFVSINFVLSNYVINVLLPADITSISNFNTTSSADISALFQAEIALMTNLIVTAIVENALLTIPMALSVLVVKNTFMQEGKSYGQIVGEVFHLLPK